MNRAVRAWLAMIAVAGLASCGSATSPSVTSINLQIVYTPPAASTLPPATPDDAMCYHHNAPLNMTVETSWGTTGRLEQMDAQHYGILMPEVLTGRSCWITFIDIALCPTGNLRVTRGVAVNGVTLTRTTTDATGRPVMAFSINGRGEIVQ